MNKELLDIYDDQMIPIGTATREDAHRIGYWHRTFHCWLYDVRENTVYIRFQKRHSSKDTNPNCYDITVAGHLTAGETVKDAVREIEEEIGVHASYENLQYIMTVKEMAQGMVQGRSYIDREVSDVFALQYSEAVHQLSLQHDEVTGIYEASAESLLSLMKGSIEQLQVEGVEISPDGSYQLVKPVISSSQFVKRKRSYYIDIWSAIVALTQ